MYVTVTVTYTHTYDCVLTPGLQALSQCDGSPDDSLAIYGVLAAHLVYVFLADLEPRPPGSSSASRCNTSGAGLTPVSGER